MEGKRFFKISLVILGTIYLCFLLQTTVFTKLAMAGIVPNILLALTTCFGYIKGRKYGLVVGFVSGIIMDIFVGGYFGLNALLLMYIGFMNGVVRIILFGDDIKLPLFLIGISDIAYGCMTFGIFYLLRERTDFMFYLKNVIVPEAVYTMVVGMGVFLVLDILIGWMDKEDKRVTKSFV